MVTARPATITTTLRRAHASARPAPSPPNVDVLVATRNRPQDLARMLPTAVRQTHADFRLLVLDQSDDPGPNREAVKRLGDLRIAHVVDRARGKSRALNQGLRLTQAPFVAFTDDGCELPAEWLAEAVSLLHANPEAGIVFGDLVAAPHDAATQFVPAIAFPRMRTLRAVRDGDLLGMGANMVLRREVLETTGLFDEELGPGGVLRTGEECELTYRVLTAGFTVLQSPRPVVVHWGARPRVGGVADDLVDTGFFAIGCGFGKHLRLGEGAALRAVFREMGRIVRVAVPALMRRRPPYHLRRLASFTRGLLVGLRRGPRWPALPSDPDGGVESPLAA